MQILFLISILCFLAVLWAALSLARRIKRTAQHEVMRDISVTPPRSRTSFNLSPGVIPGSSFIPNPIPSVVPRPSPTPKEFRHHIIAAAQAPIPEQPFAPRSRNTGLHQTAHEISANKHWDLPAKAISLRASAATQARQATPSTRKPPQPARHGPIARLDPAYFNKDSGDLSDPYQPPRLRANGTRHSPKRY